MFNRLKKICGTLLMILFIFRYAPHVSATAGGFHGGGFHGVRHNSGKYLFTNSLIGFLIPVIFWIGLICFILFFVKRNRYQKGSTIKDRALSKKIKDNFINIQNAWDNGDLYPVSDLYEDQLYHKHCKLLETYAKKNRVNRTLEVKIEGLSRYKEINHSKFEIDISFRAIDFVRDKRTKSIIKGNKSKRCFKQRWTFTTDGSHIVVSKIVEFKI